MASLGWIKGAKSAARFQHFTQLLCHDTAVAAVFAQRRGPLSYLLSQVRVLSVEQSLRKTTAKGKAILVGGAMMFEVDRSCTMVNFFVGDCDARRRLLQILEVREL